METALITIPGVRFDEISININYFVNRLDRSLCLTFCQRYNYGTLYNKYMYGVA